MEMEQTLSMDEHGPLMDYNPIYKEPETETNFRLKNQYQIAGCKLNENMDEQEEKEESDSFISMLSDDINKNKDVLEMVSAHIKKYFECRFYKTECKISLQRTNN